MEKSKDISLCINEVLMAGASCLLAFSHGLDSTALFHLLRERGILCDLALVNYGVRPEAKKEETAARELASRYGCRIFVAYAPAWESGFECHARKFRYRFFEELIDRHGYEILLTAHQLTDRLEWLLMRLGRGAGSAELAGMVPVSVRNTPGGKRYRLVRPLLETPREQLRIYLERRAFRYFEDTSNIDGSNERAELRAFSTVFSAKYASGLSRSFDYLDRDRNLICQGWEMVYAHKALRVIRLKETASASRAADEVLKDLGYLLSRAEREQIDESKPLVAGRRWAVERREAFLYIAPYRSVPIPKSFRERCRIGKIPPKIRPYLCEESIDPEGIVSSFASEREE